MKLMIASDLHGSAFYCRQLLAAMEREQPDKLLLLGDILYHGPRNDLPEGYAPKEVIAMLNPLRERLLCVRGNCDTEVDQMVLDFPILADYALLYAGSRTVFATHGHHYNTACPPAACQGGYFAARPHSCARLAGIWQRQFVSEPWFRCHPEGKQRPFLYDADRFRLCLERS